MVSAAQQQFLVKAHQAAAASGHVWPRMAACEAALESGWGESRLAAEDNNLFGQKQQQHPIYGTVDIPTREFLNHAWCVENAAWVKFPDWPSCFASRMGTLRRLAPEYPHYAMALAAGTPEEYIEEVSLSWSTDPNRAAKVLDTYRAHYALMED